MSRPDPIEYAERLYAAIRGANFSPLSFLAFGNAVKEGVEMRRMPRIAAEPFMRVVGQMIDLEEDTDEVDLVDADLTPMNSSSPIRADKSPLDRRAIQVEHAAASDGTTDSESASPLTEDPRRG